MPFADFYKNKRVFLTGHTGFKGSWLAEWLLSLGAEVHGFSLDPQPHELLYGQLGLANRIHSDNRADLLDRSALTRALLDCQPDVVFHLAAQPLVRLSYDIPVETFAINVMGTAHLLDAVRTYAKPCSVVCITTDKCYENREWLHAYREEDAMGGHDPYSASKGAAELVIASFRKSFFPPTGPIRVASARAGNVIGGGDWALDRLVPDIIRSLLKDEPTLIRNPQATRPWQHVLEPLHGYLMLAERLYTHGHEFASAWNFGPPEQSEKTVGWIIAKMYELWGVSFDWKKDENPGPPECTFLKLDASKARGYMGWRPKLDLPTTLDWIVKWTRRYQAGADMRQVSLEDIQRFMAIVPQD